MGHLRLGNLHKTRRWTQVVGMLDSGAATEDIASKSLHAGENAFAEAAHDTGFKYTVWILTQVTLAAREEDFPGRLAKIGLDVPEHPGLFDILGAFTKHILGVNKRIGAASYTRGTDQSCKGLGSKAISRNGSAASCLRPVVTASPRV